MGKVHAAWAPLDRLPKKGDRMLCGWVATRDALPEITKRRVKDVCAHCRRVLREQYGEVVRARPLRIEERGA